jgi:CubicO group peptidase (beta-lactamase class C family)
MDAGSISPSVARATRAPTARSAGRTVAGLAIVFAVLSSGGCVAGTPADSAGVSEELSADVDAYLEAVDESGMVRAVLVSHDDEVVLARYADADPEDHHDIASLTKSVASALIGIAIDEGAISGLDATLGELLPSYAVEMTSEVAAIPLRDVLTHTAGFAPGDGAVETLEYWLEPDWVQAILADRAQRHSGAGFAYSNAGSHLLRAILLHAAGMPLIDYAREHLFEPLGIVTEPALERTYTGEEENALELWEEYDSSGFAWPIDPQGNHETAGGLRLTPEDLMALGLLFLHGGQADGEQVVPRSWVEESTSPVATGGTYGDYGYQWWVSEFEGERMVLAAGFRGQLIAILPDRELVVVVASRNDLADPAFAAKAFDTGQAITMVETAIAPHFGD